MWNSVTTHSEQLYSQNMGCDTHVQGHSYKQLQKFGNHYTAVISKGLIKVKKKGKWSRNRPSVAQMVGRGIALLFHNPALEGWPAAHPGRTLPPGKTWYSLYRRLGGPQGRSGRAESLVPTRARSRTVQPVAQSLYRLSYPAHKWLIKGIKIIYDTCQKKVEKD